MIEEDIRIIRTLVEELHNQLIAIRLDVSDLSRKAEEELKTGDEPRHYKNGRKPSDK